MKVSADWNSLKATLAVTNKRGGCQACGLFLSSDGGYKLPGLPGLYCSIRCIEIELAQSSACHWCFAKGEPAGARRTYCDDLCRKAAQAIPLGDGMRLLRYINAHHPEIYHRLTSQRVCLECRVPLDGKRGDSDFCSDVHSKRFRRREKSRKTRIGGNSPDTPIGNKWLTGAQSAA